MDMEKPHKGRISHWSKHTCSSGMGYYISGMFKDHHRYAGRRGHTSFVVNHDHVTGEIETNNSRYKLLEEEVHFDD